MNMIKFNTMFDKVRWYPIITQYSSSMFKTACWAWTYWGGRLIVLKEEGHLLSWALVSLSAAENIFGAYLHVLRMVFMERTPASQSLPKWGILGGMKRHVITVCVHKCEMECRDCADSCCSSLTSLLASLEMLPSSEKICVGVPRRAQNRRIADINSSVEKSPQNYKWTAFVVKQMKRQA